MGKRRLHLIGLLLLVVGLFWNLMRQGEQAPTVALGARGDGSIGSKTASKVEVEVPDHRRIVSEGDREQAVHLAKQRKERMLEWMESDPERALQEAIGWNAYDALPEELKVHFERPFNRRADLLVLPICNAPGGGEHPPLRVLEMGNESFEASVVGGRREIGTKENTPLAGITLGGRAVVAEFALEVPSEDDAGRFNSWPLANSDPGRGFGTGGRIEEDGVTAIAGGERFRFAGQAQVDAFNRKLFELDRAPGPHSGAQVVFELADGAGEDGFDWGEAGELVGNQASSWTETPKSVFFIRVEFPDLTGESVSAAVLGDVLNTTVSSSIQEMSYGKTEINATVSSSVVMLPNPTTFYLPNYNTSVRNDAIAAYEAINGAGVLSGYDIVGVHFASIGMQSSSGLTYAGLAGGSRQWLQGTSSSNVIIHEFGHNYGLGHASYWETTDGSVVGTGSNDEYGDPYDIMGSGPDPEGHFHVQAKSHLNWLEASEWTDANVAGSGTYRIYRFDDDATTGVNRGVRVTKGMSPDEYYWLGYRRGIPANPWLEDGAYLLWQRPDSSRSWLLDATPDSVGGLDDAALTIGATYTDGVADLHLTPVGKGGSGADAWLDVSVQIGPFPGNSAPTAVLSAPGAAAARSEVFLSVSANDADADDLAYYWDFGDGSSSTNSDSVSHRWSVSGNYTVEVTVSDMKGGSVTESAVVVVTDPLDTWTEGTIAAGRTMRDIEYLDGRYIMGSNQYLSLSFDGLNWIESYIGLNYRSGGFASDGDRFVAVGYDWNGSSWFGMAHFSDDGRNWESAIVPATVELNDVAYGAGIFVAVGDDGTVLRSVDDGETWSLQSVPTVISLDAIAYGDGFFVVVADNSVFTSADGISWTDQSGGVPIPSWQSFKDVIFRDGTFYAGGWYSGVYVSTDGGVNWQPAAMLGSESYDIRALAAGDGTFLAIAERRTGTVEPVLLVSADGLIWSEGATMPLPLTSALTHGNGTFSSVFGSDGKWSHSDPLLTGNSAPTASIGGPTSGDARDWLVFSATFSDPDGDALTLVWDFGDGTPLEEGPSAVHTFPVGGSYTVTLIATDTRGGVTESTQMVTVSDPLSSWVPRTSGTTAALNDIAYGGGVLVAVGDSSGTYRSSTDAVTWSGGTLGANIRLKGVVHDGGQFIAAGYDYDFSAPAGWKGAIYTSPDGSAWTRRHFLAEELRDVAYGGGLYVAVGDGGTIWSSTDGLAWSPESSGTAIDLDGVSYGNGGFVAVGADSGGGPVVVL
ncbi:MAG: PKD domain-containing protein, partial [Verrucomicrobiota bacterium]